MKFKVMFFNPSSPEAACQFIHDKYYEGWELMSVSGSYYYFKKINGNL